MYFSLSERNNLFCRQVRENILSKIKKSKVIVKTKEIITVAIFKNVFLIPLFFYWNIVSPAKAEYSYFSANFN